jgi:hypothetical protein
VNKNNSREMKKEGGCRYGNSGGGRGDEEDYSNEKGAIDGIGDWKAVDVEALQFLI